MNDKLPGGAMRAGRAAMEAALEPGPDAEGQGRDPRRMTVDELRALGHEGILRKAVRANCIDCSGGNMAEVRRCRMAWCPLWPYRMGSNPFRKREFSEEQRAAAGERLAQARAKRYLSDKENDDGEEDDE